MITSLHDLDQLLDWLERNAIRKLAASVVPSQRRPHLRYRGWELTLASSGLTVQTGFRRFYAYEVCAEMHDLPKIAPWVVDSIAGLATTAAILPDR